MATYKLIQDIEAEDKILGPLTLRQFIFALIACFSLYICFICVTKGAAFLLVLFLPPGLFFGFFALPFGRDQPTEVWFLAKLQFWFKPRKRLWNQDGVKELVTITVPKKIERVLTNGLTQAEVKSRLRALADTIDTRGWAIKNVSTYGPAIMATDTERLLDISSLPQEVPQEVAQEQGLPIDDIVDTSQSPIAQQFDNMIAQSNQAHHQQLLAQMQSSGTNQAMSAAAPGGNWFMRPSMSTVPLPPASVDIAQAQTQPRPPTTPTADEAALSAQLKLQAKSQQLAYGNLHTLQPLGGPVTVPAPVAASPIIAAAPSDPAILSLANNNDFNVDTLAREAKKAKDNESEQNEVVISLR